MDCVDQRFEWSFVPRQRVSNGGRCPPCCFPRSRTLALRGVSRGKKWWRLTPSKVARREATAFEQAPRTAGAEVVAAELLVEEFVPMHDPHAAFHGGLRGVAATPLAHRLKTMLRLRGRRFVVRIGFLPRCTSSSVCSNGDEGGSDTASSANVRGCGTVVDRIRATCKKQNSVPHARWNTLFAMRSLCRLTLYGPVGRVSAPSQAGPTRRAYFAIAPRV